MLKRTISIVLTFCLLFMLLLTSCAKTPEAVTPAEPEPEAPEVSEPAKDTEDEPEPDDEVVDWWEPYPEPVTITIFNAMATDAIYPDGDDIEHNIWTREYKERFNIDVVTEWVSDDYATKLNLAISSKSLADMFHVDNAQFAQLKEAGALYDITDVYEDYVSDGMRSLMESDPDVFETAKTDGRLFGTPHLHYGYMSMPNYVWLRKDWMEEGQYEPPETIEELEAIMKDFMAKHGGYGMAIDQTLRYLLYMTPCFGAYHDIWVDGDDGTIQYSSIQPEMKTALETFAQWYKDGILDSEFASKDYNAMIEDVVNGKVGAQPFLNWWGYAVGPDIIRNISDKAYFEPYALPSADGKKVMHPVPFPNSAYSVVNKDCKHPEALIKLLNFKYYIANESVALGDKTVEEVTTYTGNNLDHITRPFYFQNPLDEFNQYVEVQEGLRLGDSYKFNSPTAQLKYNCALDFLERGDPDGIGYVLQVGADRCSYAVGKSDVEEDNFIRSKLWGETPEIVLEYGSTLKDLLVEGFTKIIVGAEPIDYFETIVENWKAAGGDEATAAVNAAYK
ncbi:MAG: extracellular solute-binding protein [Clostridiales bacterium]|nr:extracellular solute-binding protein [Clostridiales bacterium]